MVHPLDRLDVSTRALKRAQYEAFTCQPTGDGIRIRNESHADPAEHVYTVTITGGVPTACTCPADRYGDTACKHRIAVAIRQPIPDTGIDPAAVDADRSTPVTDGGDATADSRAEERADAVADGCSCADLPGSFPCWPCVRAGRRAVPDPGTTATDGDG